MFQAVRHNVLQASRHGMFASARNSVGADILLARHGGAIYSMRVDRGRGQVVATLADGTTDSAPNLIDPALERPGRLNDDSKLIAAVCAATVGLAAAMTAAVGIAFSLASPEQLAGFTAAMGSYTAAM
ncbi:hypothetical protein [Arthrobacter wenxiniae]|uniref:Uncharacterized protein n=1 Tax=Arthrobacter wenxiniae TaxID=2713570 RepID=A0A7Y7IFT5_9MICC|nr:hypothetical protein [Arthrobacter wenxiniae]